MSVINHKELNIYIKECLYISSSFIIVLMIDGIVVDKA